MRIIKLNLFTKTASRTPVFFKVQLNHLEGLIIGQELISLCQASQSFVDYFS